MCAHYFYVTVCHFHSVEIDVVLREPLQCRVQVGLGRLQGMKVNSFSVVTRESFLKCFSCIMLQSKNELPLFRNFLNLYYMLLVTSM
jgi:hypothetical protein